MRGFANRLESDCTGLRVALATLESFPRTLVLRLARIHEPVNKLDLNWSFEILAKMQSGHAPHQAPWLCSTFTQRNRVVVACTWGLEHPVGCG